MYAIVRTGGKQYKVSAGDTLYLERIEAAVGDSVSLEEVLCIGGDGELRVGRPTLDQASVVGTVLEQGRDSKIRVFKYKKRKHYRRTRGHRQAYTAVRVDAIQG